MTDSGSEPRVCVLPDSRLSMWDNGDRAGAAKMSQGERLRDTREGPGEMAETKWKCQRGLGDTEAMSSAAQVGGAL